MKTVTFVIRPAFDEDTQRAVESLRIKSAEKKKGWQSNKPQGPKPRKRGKR